MLRRIANNGHSSPILNVRDLLHFSFLNVQGRSNVSCYDTFLGFDCGSANDEHCHNVCCQIVVFQYFRLHYNLEFVTAGCLHRSRRRISNKGLKKYCIIQLIHMFHIDGHESTCIFCSLLIKKANLHYF